MAKVESLRLVPRRTPAIDGVVATGARSVSGSSQTAPKSSTLNSPAPAGRTVAADTTITKPAGR